MEFAKLTPEMFAELVAENKSLDAFAKNVSLQNIKFQETIATHLQGEEEYVGIIEDLQCRVDELSEKVVMLEIGKGLERQADEDAQVILLFHRSLINLVRSASAILLSFFLFLILKASRAIGVSAAKAATPATEMVWNE